MPWLRRVSLRRSLPWRRSRGHRELRRLSADRPSAPRVRSCPWVPRPSEPAWLRPWLSRRERVLPLLLPLAAGVVEEEEEGPLRPAEVAMARARAWALRPRVAPGDRSIPVG